MDKAMNNELCIRVSISQSRATISYIRVGLFAHGGNLQSRDLDTDLSAPGMSRG